MTPAEGRLAMQAMLRGKPESYEEARAAFKLLRLLRGWWDVIEDDHYRCGLRYQNQGAAICQPKDAPVMQPDGPECPTCGGWHVVPCYNIFCDPPEPHECLDCDFEQDWPSIHSAPIDFCEPGALTAEHDIQLEVLP